MSLRQRFALRQLRIGAMGMVDRAVSVERGRVTLVAKKNFGISGNIRVVAEAMAERLPAGSVSLYYEGVLPADTQAALEARGIRLLRRFDPRSARAVAASALIVVDHSIRDCYIARRKPGRAVANIWHGVPIKAIELAMPKLDETRRELIMNNAALYDYMIASSRVDRMAVASCFGVPPDRVAITGLPRYDLLRSQAPLADDLVAREQRLLREKGDRRVVLYAPTFREAERSPVEHLLPHLRNFAERLAPHGVVLAVRPHQYDRAASALRADDGYLVWSNDVCQETNLLLRHADALVTDFSSVWVDYMLLNRPILGYAPNFDHYAERERGFLYPFDTVFPGPFHHDPDALLGALLELAGSGVWEADHSLQQRLFFEQTAPPATPRVVEDLCALLG